ncbi:DUF5131 family protein [Candidatus Pacearchaeota archaeon]|nr:DUF5131 family protein [Candidatus Pacearchaeota archaeon]
MALNKIKGNMYDFVSHTWNVCKGICSHDCEYCFMKRFKNQKPLRLDEKEFKTDLGKDNFIFVGSSTDMFAKDVSKEWIIRVLENCKLYDNEYLFQTKNPKRFEEFLDHFPKKSVLGITLESNRDIKNCNAPNPKVRAIEMLKIPFNPMITIEPIMDFDLEEFVKIIQELKPKFVNIGADSLGHKLPEPSWTKIQQLIKELEKFTKVNLKTNLRRLNK